jgi:DUF4097 and DUF4098 domain-containing protein YvlB
MNDETWMPRVRGWTVGMLAMSLVLAGSAAAQDRTMGDDEWCEGHDRHGGVSVCEVREWTMRAQGKVSVDAKPNGGISVEAWDRSEMQVRAKVHAWAGSEAKARDLVESINVKAGASVSADGPRTGKDEGWSVSYQVMVPRDTNLDLASTNGGITIGGVRGELRFQTTNGGIHLEDIAGKVEGRTTNGGVNISLTGSTWDGEGMEVQTTNGGVKMSIPSGYSAHLETATTNGGMNIGFPVTVQGKIDHKLSVDLGGGGPILKVTTTNGGVRITEG